MTRPVLVQICRFSLPYATEDGGMRDHVVDIVYGLTVHPQPFADAVAAAVAHAPAGRIWTVRGLELRSRDEEGSWAITAFPFIDEGATEATMTDEEYYGPVKAIYAALAA